MKRTLTILAVAILSVTVSRAERVATMDLEKVFRAHPKTDRAIEALGKEAEGFKVEQRALLKEHGALEDEIRAILESAENMMLTEKAREGKKIAAREKLGKLKAMERRLRENRTQRQRELTDQELRMREELVGEIRRTATEYAKNNKIDVVLNSSTSNIPGNEPVICAADSTDITVAVMKAMGIDPEEAKKRIAARAAKAEQAKAERAKAEREGASRGK